ncbi:hypothetical protein BKA62DRAFT_652614 [Auriculariales sp. MPI-PUGE-AT-0066]|nr:hypothetical protein BKA62DRAFT_652614 [Auriculariales sp. MPI-PUGE-AT-0066]
MRRVLLRKTTNAVPVHRARCDLCNRSIAGSRWKCLDCPDWDACAECQSMLISRHPRHRFVRIDDPSQLLGAANTQHDAVGQPHSSTCDACDQPIHGVRYKCMHPNCPDYDLCAICEALPANIHPEDHPFLKLKSPNMTVPLPPPIRSTARHSATCDQCRQSLTGAARFKCIDSQCPDFDLCEQCYSIPQPRRAEIHPLGHRMLKITTRGGTGPNDIVVETRIVVPKIDDGRNEAPHLAR